MLELGVLTLNWLQALLLPLTRITAFFLTAPVFSQSAATGRIRIVYAAALCLLIMPVLPTSISNPERPFGEPTLLLVLGEILIGVSMGLVLQFVTAAVVMAGEQISMAVGIGFAQSFDPTIGSTPVLSGFLNIFALLIFLTAGGHAVVISMIAESIQVLPPGEFHFDNMVKILEFSKVIFVGAALLAAPLLFTLIAVNLGVGALSRATPQLNVFAVGFAVNLLVGFGLLFLVMPALGERITELWQQAQLFLRAQFLARP
ncbi:MAG: flagellar biosynthetic protein FliR [Gammaproteobacteria bacterium]|nr:flagellar biosynthetic protein FliR [Gammaproteobacteria bacterium]